VAYERVFSLLPESRHVKPNSKRTRVGPCADGSRCASLPHWRSHPAPHAGWPGSYPLRGHGRRHDGRRRRAAGRERPSVRGLPAGTAHRSAAGRAGGVGPGGAHGRRPVAPQAALAPGVRAGSAGAGGARAPGAGGPRRAQPRRGGPRGSQAQPGIPALLPPPAGVAGPTAQGTAARRRARQRCPGGGPAPAGRRAGESGQRRVLRTDESRGRAHSGAASGVAPRQTFVRPAPRAPHPPTPGASGALRKRSARVGPALSKPQLPGWRGSPVRPLWRSTDGSGRSPCSRPAVGPWSRAGVEAARSARRPDEYLEFGFCYRPVRVSGGIGIEASRDDRSRPGRGALPRALRRRPGPCNRLGTLGKQKICDALGAAVGSRTLMASPPLTGLFPAGPTP
jgi:hypothetical protein